MVETDLEDAVQLSAGVMLVCVRQAEKKDVHSVFQVADVM
jgi:hypothetical protein